MTLNEKLSKAELSFEKKHIIRQKVGDFVGLQLNSNNDASIVPVMMKPNPPPSDSPFNSSLKEKEIVSSTSKQSPRKVLIRQTPLKSISGMQYCTYLTLHYRLNIIYA